MMLYVLLFLKKFLDLKYLVFIRFNPINFRNTPLLSTQIPDKIQSGVTSPRDTPVLY